MSYADVSKTESYCCDQSSTPKLTCLPIRLKTSKQDGHRFILETLTHQIRGYSHSNSTLQRCQSSNKAKRRTSKRTHPDSNHRHRYHDPMPTPKNTFCTAPAPVLFQSSQSKKTSKRSCIYSVDSPLPEGLSNRGLNPGFGRGLIAISGLVGVGSSRFLITFA